MDKRTKQIAEETQKLLTTVQRLKELEITEESIINIIAAFLKLSKEKEGN